MNIDENLAITIGGGFFAGALIGLALGKSTKNTSRSSRPIFYWIGLTSVPANS